MGDIRHRIGLGTVGGSSLTGKNDVNQDGGIVELPPFTFDRTDIKMDTRIRKFDEIKP